MKKLLLLLGLAALCAGFVGCNEPNVSPSDDSEVPEEIGILPVSASDISEEVSAFFDEYVNSLLIKDKEIKCLTINNTDELEGILPSNVELPEMDFDMYTLVVGRYIMPQGGYVIKDQGIDNELSTMKLNLVLENTGKGLAAVFYPTCWGLYPKLPQKNIVFNLIYID